MTVSWRMEADDFLDAAQLRWRRNWWGMRAFVVLSAGLGFGSQVFTADPTVWVPPYALAAGMAIYQSVWIPRGVRKQWRSVIGETETVRLDEAGLHSDFAGVHTSAEWRTLTKVTGNANSIVIRVDPGSYLFIPKRAFAGTEEVDDFLTYVRIHHAGRTSS